MCWTRQEVSPDVTMHHSAQYFEQCAAYLGRDAGLTSVFSLDEFDDLAESSLHMSFGIEPLKIYELLVSQLGIWSREVICRQMLTAGVLVLHRPAP